MFVLAKLQDLLSHQTLKLRSNEENRIRTLKNTSWKNCLLIKDELCYSKPSGSYADTLWPEFCILWKVKEDRSHKYFFALMISSGTFAAFPHPPSRSLCH